MGEKKEKKVGVFRDSKIIRFEDILATERGKFRAVLKPACNIIEVPTRLDQGGIKGKVGTHKTMGNYFEGVTTALYGGIPQNHLFVGGQNDQYQLEYEEAREYVNPEGLPDGILIKPDHVDVGAGVLSETKSWKVGGELHLRDPQIFRYLELQKQHPASEFWVNMYCHAFQNIKSNPRRRSKSPMNEFKLHRSLSRGTLASIRLPLSVLVSLHGKWLENGGAEQFTRVADTGTYDPCVLARPEFMEALFRDPENALEGLGLDPKNYRVVRKLSPGGLAVRLNGGTFGARKFPILSIVGKSEREWIRDEFPIIYGRAKDSMVLYLESRKQKKLLALQRLQASAAESGVNLGIDCPAWVRESLEQIVGKPSPSEVGLNDIDARLLFGDEDDDDLPF
jgi:hypothetical protein